MANFDKIIFKNKTFGNILEEIYKNQISKSTKISSLIAALQPLVEDTTDATLIVPLIKEYLDVDIKNDEQLIKMAQIIQRVLNKDVEESTNSQILSEEDKEELLKMIGKIEDKKKDGK